MLHRQSVQAADLAHNAFKLAHQALDALGASIVETARQRKQLELRARTTSGFARRELQMEIDSLHQMRDLYLVPDKNRVKAEKNRLLAEVRQLNIKTAQLRETKAERRAELQPPRVQATVKRFDRTRGFGFLTLADGRELYVNAQQVRAGTVLMPGMTVWCTVRTYGDGKSSAADVSILR